MRPKIRCDRYYAKIFGSFRDLNLAWYVVTSIHVLLASSIWVYCLQIIGNHGGMNLDCMAHSASQLSVQCMLQWIAKPSWHKLNHQNCSAACQDAKPLYDYFPLSSRHKRRSIDQCASVHALQGVSCLLLRNMPCRKLPILATFSAPSKVDASTSISSPLPKSYTWSRQEKGLYW
jgi:hypothetical protein